MMMKTALTSSVLVALFAANAGAAANYVTTAATNSKATATVHFTGDIVASTCVVNTATTDKNITLPQVTNQLFSGAGSSTGDTSFTLQFTNCQGSTGGNGYVVVFTDKNHASSTTLLQANRGSTPATDVGIEVDYAGKALNFSSGKNEVDLNPTGANGNAEITLVAKYQQIGATLPAAGTITADMNYTVIYK